MRLPRFYCPQLEKGVVVLPTDEARHAMASLRARAGDEVVLFDGLGGEGRGTIVTARRRQVEVEVPNVVQRPFECARRITLAVAMSRAHRQGYLVEKCTELGVAAIWPIVTERCVARPDAASCAKWARRALEAAKQSQRAWLPILEPPQTLERVILRITEFHASAVADTRDTAGPLCRLLEAQPMNAALLVFVGPEGGWSDGERRQLAAGGVVPVRLAPTVLRIETAAVAVCAAAAMLDQTGSTIM